MTGGLLSEQPSGHILTEYLMEILLIHIINGISFGAFLFIIASGFTLALGIMQIVNIAHGALYLISAYIAWTIWQVTGNFILTIVVSVVPAMFIGITTLP